MAATLQAGHDIFGIMDLDDTQAMDIDDNDQLYRDGHQPAPSLNPAPSLTTAPSLNPAPTPRNASHAIDATPFAGPYRSVFTLTGPPSADILACLKYVNCSYLSTKGIAPTLLQLKQHAHSLAVLIKQMTVSTMPALIDNAHANMPGATPFHENQSFDWLDNLTQVYENSEPHHQMPLTSLMNALEPNPQMPQRPKTICPMHHAENAPANGQSLPYATHQSMIQHANEILERLDHEYSARGGLLSIFPTKMQSEDRAKAEQTVLGQLILWVQNLVQRVHHLERLYANAMDILSKEAVVPTQTLSRLGPDGRKPREPVYPQDRFVLVNAGEDLWQYLNSEFERKEVADKEVDRSYRDHGVTGEAIWEKRGGREFARGITCIDVYTRYYRLREHALKTIFVIPAYEKHPGTKVTREMERQPTVVSVVKPVWPERASVLEMRHRGDMEDLRRFKRESGDKDRRIDNLTDETKLLMAERASLQGELREAQKKTQELWAALNEPGNQSKLAVLDQSAEVAQAREEAARMRDEYERQKLDAAKHLSDAQARATEMSRMKKEHHQKLTAIRAQHQAEWEERQRVIDDRDRDVARGAEQLEAKLRAVWTKQITETQVLIEFLTSRRAQGERQGLGQMMAAVVVGDERVSEEAQGRGARIALEAIRKALEDEQQQHQGDGGGGSRSGESRPESSSGDSHGLGQEGGANVSGADKSGKEPPEQSGVTGLDLSITIPPPIPRARRRRGSGSGSDDSYKPPPPSPPSPLSSRDRVTGSGLGLGLGIFMPPPPPRLRDGRPGSPAGSDDSYRPSPPSPMSSRGSQGGGGEGNGMEEIDRR